MIFLGLFAFLLLLSDVHSASAPVAYDHALQLFVHGDLIDAQKEAGQGYRRFLYSDPRSARKFQLLEASAMAWRSLYEDLLKLLADDRIDWNAADDEVQRQAFKVRAFTELHRFPEASQSLAEGERLCAETHAGQCGALIRARGMLFVEHGDLASGKKDLQASLSMAGENHDGMMVGVGLLNLGYIASQQELHDEASQLDQAASEIAIKLGAKDLEQRALGDEAWEQFQSGNPDKALDLFEQAERQAVALGDKGSEINWLLTEALIYGSTKQLALAEKTDLRAIELARRIHNPQDVIDASMDLALVYVNAGQPDASDRYSNQALAMQRATGSELDLLNVKLIQGQAAALRHDWPRADALLHEVSAAADSQGSMKWNAQRSLGNIYEAQGDPARAEQAYKVALALVEGTRAALKQEESRLTFLSKAARIYDDYIHFLVANGKSDAALEAADWSRARTLQQGLGLIASSSAASSVPPPAPPPIHAVEIARKANATLLFYWLGERQSYLWAVSKAGTTLIPLPAKGEIVPRIEHYRRALLDLKDPLKDGNRDGRALYETLVAPAAKIIPPGGRAVLFADGEMTELNFETLVVDPGPSTSSATGVGTAPHYWIEDATVISAPSIRMFAAARPAENAGERLLLLGDSISPGPEFPPLPMAPVEVQKIQPQFSAGNETIFTRERATPAAYMKSKPEQFTYIHFVSHGTASRLDPLDSAVVLSPDPSRDPSPDISPDPSRDISRDVSRDQVRDRSKDQGGVSRGENGQSSEGDSYKLYARDILRHPIDARLVTISACDSSGAKSVAGEGLVGVSWAFLRAGAHNAIGALWDVSDASTPELMNRMYRSLEQGEAPADALREAKLSLLHAGGKFAKPFYWAPFQLYAGR